MIYTIISGAIGSTFTAFVGYVVWRLKNRHTYQLELTRKGEEDLNLRREGLIYILRQMLIHTYREAESRGYTNHQEFSGFMSMYSVYTDMGGNGYITRLAKLMEQMDIRG